MRQASRSVGDRQVVAALIVLHLLLVAFCAVRYSFAATEVGLLPAGIIDWRYGSFDVYRVNPPLVRMWGTIPVVASGGEVPFRGVISDPRSRAEWEVATSMFEADSEAAYRWLVWSRLFCLPFAFVGIWVASRWAWQLYGRAAGLGAAILWTFFPSFIGYGCLISGDMQAASMGLVSFYLFRSWLVRPGLASAYLLGVVVGLTMLTKSSWLILLGLLPVLWLVIRLVEFRQSAAATGSPPTGSPPTGSPPTGSPPTFSADHVPETGDSDNAVEGKALGRMGAREWLRQAGTLVFAMSMALLIVNLLYGFGGSFRRLDSYDFISRSLVGSDDWQTRGSGNRFRDTWLGVLPVPLPENLVIGVDLQKWDFDRERWSYFLGQWQPEGWWYYYLFGLAIKLPLGFWLLFTLSVVGSFFRRSWRGSWQDELLVWLPPLIVIMGASMETGLNRHVRYVMPALPFLILIASRSFRVFEQPSIKLRGIVVAATAWLVTSSLWIYPHSLSYFNESIGGPMRADRYLNASNLDWGQDLLYVRRWQEANPEARPLWVRNWVARATPEKAGIETQGPVPTLPRDIRRPRGVSSPDREPRFRPGWYVIDRESQLSRGGEYDYLRSLQPSAWAGYGFQIFEITPQHAAELERRYRGTELE